MTQRDALIAGQSEPEMPQSISSADLAKAAEPSPLPSPPGTGQVSGADPFPGLVDAVEHAPPKRDNGKAD
ncbi:hypothetical protein SAMN04487779_10578 [Belnapia rosea]|uniref:Uncharacterized protein n=1 Tax=Belnapia rosea TaxID=938405 RepID=A0A1G7E0G2_9PROT|nr:hypothetical protein SAMN04487779_10578 [Belnapia rosea]